MKLTTENLPKKISPCPIIESIFQIKFSTSYDISEIFNLRIMEIVKDLFPDNKPMKINSFPDDLRQQDNSIKYLPEYLFQDMTFRFEFGRNSLVWKTFKGYIGFDNWEHRIRSIYDQVKAINEIREIHSLGLRYINLFENHNISATNLALSLNNDSMMPLNPSIRFVDTVDNYSLHLQLTQNPFKKKGMTVDLDVIKSDNLPKAFNDSILDELQHMHLIEKSVFFTLFKKEIINNDFNPVY